MEDSALLGPVVGGVVRSPDSNYVACLDLTKSISQPIRQLNIQPRYLEGKEKCCQKILSIYYCFYYVFLCL